MTQQTSPTRGLPRRSVVRAGLWTAPVIVVAAAVPSFAASPTSFRYNPGATVPFRVRGYPSVNFQGASVEALGSDVPVGALTIRVSAQDPVSGTVHLIGARPFPGFTLRSMNGSTSVTYTNAVAIAVGAPLALEDADHFAANNTNATAPTDSIFTLLFRVGAMSSVATYDTTGYRASGSASRGSTPQRYRALS